MPDLPERRVRRATTPAFVHPPWLSVYLDELEGGPGGTFVRIVESDGRPGVAVLPLRGNQIGRVWVFRPAVSDWCLEIPRGFGESHDPRDDAARELAEETGVRVAPADLVPLGRMQANTGLLASPVHLFLALVDERFIHSRSVAALDVRSAMCAPLVSRNGVLGLVYVDSHKANAFTRRDLALFSALALKVAIAVDNARLYDDLRSLFYNTVETLVRTIQAKDQYTAGHSTRVSRYALMIADKLGLSTKDKHQLYLAAMLHDIGKIGVPDDLLNRPGKLSDAEMERVRGHVQVGASMIEMLGEMHSIVPLIRHHHECYDGSGYPDGLKGEQIPLISRIIAVADMYDAMTSDRPYRKRRSHQFAVDEIISNSGITIDPKVADAFLVVLKEIVPATASAPETTSGSPAR